MLSKEKKDSLFFCVFLFNSSRLVGVLLDHVIADCLSLLFGSSLWPR